METGRQLATFYLDGYLFGVDVAQVQEVLPYQEMTRVPLASPTIEGLINLRGQIVTAIDLRQRLDFPERPAGNRPMNVVLNLAGSALSLLVDEVGDVLTVCDDDFEPPPATLHGSVRDLTTGTYKLPGSLLVALDAQQVCNIPEK